MSKTTRSQLIALALTVGGSMFGCKQISSISDIKRGFERDEKPEIFGVTTARFEDLPTEQYIRDSLLPWRDSYWPYAKGGITARWQNGYNNENFSDFMNPAALPSAIAQNGVFAYREGGMSRFEQQELEDQINQLSPIEKYDLYQSDKRFTSTNQLRTFINEMSQREGGKIAKWQGICHGWALASLKEREPQPQVTVTNRWGIPITFYTTDVRALYSSVYGSVPDQRTEFLGLRCDKRPPRNGERRGDIPCSGVNAGSFHLAITQLINQNPLDQSLIVDVSRFDEIWNHPVVGYEVVSSKKKRLGRGNYAPGTKSLMEVSTLLYYAVESDPGDGPNVAEFQAWLKRVKGIVKSGRMDGRWRDKPVCTSRVGCVWRLNYDLELNVDGEIIGGEWLSKSRPDFMWRMKGQLQKPDLGNLTSIDLDVVRALANP